MNKTLTRLFTIALLMMVSMGARAEVKVLFGEKGTELQPAKDGTITLGQKELTGGTIFISQEEQKDGTSKVTFAVTPDKNYKLAEDGLEVYAVIPTDISSTRGLEVSTTLTLKSEDFKDEASKRTNTTTIDSKLALWVKSAKFESASKGGSTRATNYKYVIINNKGNKAFNYTIRGDINYTSINKEQLCVHPKAKSVLATNFRFYTTEHAAKADASSGVTGTEGTDYYTEGTTISGIEGVTDNTFYVRYSLKDNPAIDISGEKLYKIQARNRAGTLFYIAYQTSDKTIRIKSTDSNNDSFLWKIESGDPYDMYIYNLQGTADHSNGVFTVRNIVDASGESALNSIYYDDEITSGYNQSASSMNLQSFILTQGSNEGYQYNNNWKTIWESSYQIIGAYNAIENKPRDEGSNTYALPGNMPYYVCVNGSGDSAPGKNGDQLQFYRNWRVEDPSNKNTSQIKFIEVKQAYTFHIINNSGEEAVCASTASELNAGATITASMIPDIIKSPLASNYTFYSTAADAAAGSNTNALTRLPYPSQDVYVRYTTNGGSLNLTGGTNYYVLTNGNYLYASSASTIGIESSATSTDDTRKWKKKGNDAYQLTLQNADNSNYVTYNVSSGEAVPTLSASGSKFFLHQSTNGKYELVAVTTNDFSTTDYYTLGVANNTLKLYSKTNYPLGNDAVQTFFSDHDFCAKPVISFDNSNNQITIDCATAGASIYYTDDGTPPTSSSTLYTGAFTVSDGTTIKAIATKAESDDSEVASLTIVLTPTITLEGTPCTYDGTEKEPTVSSVKVGETIIDPSEYTVSYSNNINVGSTATVTITDNEGGDYYVAGDITFTIDPLSIGSGTTPATGFKIDVSMSGSNYVVTVKHGETTLTQGTDYTWTGGPEVTVTGIGNYTGTAKALYVPVTPGYYALHQNGKGYLKVSGAGVNLGNDGTFQSGNLFDKGNCIWYMTPQGYLQNEYFYLNVANNKTLYLSVNPVTRWRSEDVTGENTYGKKHLKINNGTEDLYLCNDNNSITLKNNPSAYYSACPVDVEEVENSWAGPTAENLTVQSPQLVTYLRAYFTQKIKYTFHNDAGAEVKSTDGKHERRVYATIAYKEGGNKGTDWDIDESGILYNKKASGEIEFTATYNILPADPVALSAHSTAATKDIKYKVTQKPLAPTAGTDYLLYSISGGDSYRYPYDDGVTDGGPVKPDGKGGTGNTSVLTDPDTNKNLQISWKITADEEGFYTFQNSSTGKYLYYDETAHTSSDFGVLRLSSAPTGNSAKFRLYKTSDTNYSECYYLIPYSKLFAVYKSNAVADGLYVALNNKDYTGDTPVISLSKPNANSTWCIYKYEAEYRIREDFTITGPSSAEAVGNYNITSEGWYGRYIKQSPRNGSGQRGLVIKGTYKDNVDYIWTVTGLGNYINISDGTNTDGTWSKTTNGNANDRKLVVNVTSLPVSNTSGVITLKLSGYSAPNTNVRTSSEKTFAFTILGDGAISFTDITSLAGITSSSGAYRLVGGNGSNFAYSDSNKPGITTFSGVLDGNNQTISGLNAPLFDNLSNGTVRNVNLSGVGISNHSGPTGAIAGTADGGSRIYNVGILDGEVGSNGDVCGGLVGKLDGSARVINCFSYAKITGGSTVGGIVGNNCYASKSNDIRTMVMNCMFYGNITATGDKAPIYNGESIDNFWSSDTNQGLNNYNYFRFDQPYVSSINHYNCALGAEDRYLDRFEFFRHTLNSNRELAAWYITGNADDGKGENNIMAKWVLEPSQIGTDTPYPILKPQNTYPSVVNHDAANAVDIGDEKVNHNKGRKFGKLTVNISLGTGYPTGAALREGKSSLTLNITDKDTEHYDFNYRKVQLPYYNEVGTGNYTHNKVVTGWKMTVSGGTTDFVNTGTDAPAFNFVDRKSTGKDNYKTSGRVFSQGAYYEVPDGVTSISIEPYWADCVYLADAALDVTYSTGYAEKQSTTAHYTNDSSYPINGDNQVVYTTFDNARKNLNPTSGNNVYDKAIVLVGNYHKDFNTTPFGGNNVYPMTIMSADLNNDNEPDYCFFYAHNAQQNVTPIRFDFINLPAISMALKPTGATAYKQAGVFYPKGWFEITNTALIRFGQFEYGRSNVKTISAPLILMGGIYEQFLSCRETDAGNTPYIHIGGNAWFNEFNNGCHTKASNKTPKNPISVSGGDYNKFYLSGAYRPDVNPDAENAECYIDGGRFGEVAGAGMQKIDGSVTWIINGADIENFYGGGINPAKPITGNLSTTITDSWVTNFYGGPKFGDMATGKTVITNATGCHFGNYFGAGYGGNAFNRDGPVDATHDNTNNVSESTWNGYITSYYGRAYNSGKGGISTSFDYEYLIHSNTTSKVARFFVNYASLSLASTRNVTSTLTGCTISHNFYGGGSLGSVNGDVTSTLTNCTVEGSVFGAGFSATTPTIDVMNKSNFVVAPSYDYNAGVFNDGQVKYPATVKYTWTNDASKFTLTGSSLQYFYDSGDTHLIYTSTQLSDLGRVTGTVKLNIEGNTLIKGYELDDEGEITTKQTGGVFGGGDASGVTGNTEVNIEATSQKTEGYNAYNVYGGGNSAPVTGNTEVNLKKNTIINGNVYGGGNEGVVSGSTTVNILP